MRCAVQCMQLLEMDVVLRDKDDASHWVYRGEGALNLVLSYTGSSPAFVCNSHYFFAFYSMQCSAVQNYSSMSACLPCCSFF